LRRILLILVALAIITGCGLVLAGPWFEAEGYALPWAPPPREPYAVTTSPAEVDQGGLWGITVSPVFQRPLLAVSGVISGLPSAGEVGFYQIDGKWVAYLPVSYAATPGRYDLALKIVDHRRREHSCTVTLPVVERSFVVQRFSATAQQTSVMTADRLAEDRAKINAARANPSLEPLWSGPFLMPVQGRLTSEFGLTRYVNGVLYGRHSGLDLAAPTGTPVAAAARGRVTFAGDLWASGTSVILDHGLGLFTAYNHLSKILVAEGQIVDAGEIVGLVGSTGFSTGPHLHFTVWHGSVPTNPWPWFDQDPLELLGMDRGAGDDGMR